MSAECCGVELIDGYSLVSHLKANHTLRGGDFCDADGRPSSFACVLPGCHRSYKSITTFRRHLDKFHSEFMDMVELNFDSNYELLTNSEIGLDINHVDFQEPLPSNADDYEMEIELEARPVPELQFELEDRPKELTEDQNYAILLQQLRLENKTNQKTVNTIASGVLNFAKEHRLIAPESSDQLIRISNSTYRQLKHCDEVLGNKNFVKRIKMNDGELVYVDLRLQLIHILQQDHIRSEIFNERFQPPSSSCFKSYKEAAFYEEPENEKEIRIQLVPYYDDIDVKSGGSSGALTKMSCSYLTILNLKYAHQCKRDDILFNAIASKSEMAKVGKHEFFKPLVQAVNEINSNPIRLSDGYFVTVNIAMCAADLLASHFLQDISTSFRWNSCQYCQVGDANALKQFHQTKFNRAPPKELSINHVFRDVANLRGRIFGPDNFHVLNEGVEEWISVLVLSRLSVQNRSKVDEDCRLKFKTLFKNGVPFGMRNGDLNGTGVQKQNFFELLSILVDDSMIDKESSVWKLYLQARKIVDFATSDFYEKQDLPVFEQEVEDFVYNFVLIAGYMKPKVHLLQHYPDLIKEFSVLRDLETKRQERTNRLLKLFTLNSSNSSYAIQMANSWTLNFLMNAFKSESKEVVFESYSSFEIRAHLTERLIRFVDLTKDLIVFDCVQLNDTIIKRDATYLFKHTSSNSLPTFVTIKCIFKQENSLRIISSPVYSEHFLKKVHCFRVRTSDELMELNLNQLAHYKILTHIKISGIELINKTFYVPFRFSSLYN